MRPQLAAGRARIATTACGNRAAPIIRAALRGLLREPRRYLEQLLQFLGVEFSAAYSRAIELLNLQPTRSKWKTEWNASQLATVLREIQPMLGQLGYAD
jgi:hypothetical protein